MKCQKCKIKEATNHFSKTLMGVKQEFHLCDQCLKVESSFFNPLEFNLSNIDNFTKGFINLHAQNFDVNPVNVDLNNLITGFFTSILGNIKKPETEVKEEPHCSLCNTTFEEFIKNGKLGCANCYDTFRNRLVDPLKKIHGNSNHNGKIPNRIGGEIKVKRKIEILRKKLNDAIIKQNFEEAAILRDKIKEIENSDHKQT